MCRKLNGSNDEYGILLIDDDRSLRETLSIILKDSGFSVHAAHDGASALNVSGVEHINASIIDYTLPDMSGFELAKKLRDINPDMCIVMMTGHDSLDISEEMMGRNIDEYLVKPVDPSMLEKILRRILKERNLFKENKKLIGNLESVNRELRKLDQLKSDFLSMVSHELCTPLFSVSGYAELLLMEKEGPLNLSQKEAVRTIKEESESLNNIIQDLLNLSRIESGRLEMMYSKCSIIEMVNKIVKRMKFKLEKKHIQLDLNLPENGIFFNADIYRIEQVLTNFLTNAVKFTNNNGRIEVRAYEKGSRLVVEVLDNGAGIIPEDIGKVFDKFFQVKGKAG
ncbi:MAG: response regulator, partial [Planctomycetota bacterium]